MQKKTINVLKTIYDVLGNTADCTAVNKLPNIIANSVFKYSVTEFVNGKKRAIGGVYL